MAWKALDRKTKIADPDAAPLLDDAVRDKIRSFLPRYEEKRAALLPALHVVQDALGHVPYRAMMEVAELLDIHASDILDTISFYTHFWTHEKGRKVITVCRSISCELTGGRQVLDELRKRLGINIHETTADGEYSLVTEECLAGCDHAPCLLINEKLHKCVRPEDVEKLLADKDNDRVTMPRSDLFDAPVSTDGDDGGNDNEGEVGTTSDIAEMKDAD